MTLNDIFLERYGEYENTYHGVSNSSLLPSRELNGHVWAWANCCETNEGFTVGQKVVESSREMVQSLYNRLSWHEKIALEDVPTWINK